jgi:signal transduction histidine kinase
MLSGIITSIIRTHVTDDKVKKLELSNSVLTQHYEDSGVESLETYVSTNFGSSAVTLFPLLNVDYEFNILITNADGRILLSTFLIDEDGAPSTGGDLGILPLDNRFSQTVGNDGNTYYVYNGTIEGITDQQSMVYCSKVESGGVIRGYIYTLASTSSEDRLIGVSRSAVINGSIWVMLAALVAAYFITDRIVQPMKSMTKAAKKFAKGDFSERIAVSGVDEVAELSIAFNNMAESLDNLEKMRNTFLASVSHDLRTPMTTIAGFIDGINSGAIPPEEQGHYLGIVSSEVHRLSKLVSQILDVSRLDSGDRKFMFADFDIAEVARLIIISFEHKLDDKGLDVEFLSDDDTMPAFADKDAIHQVLYNLCHNAIKFSKEGGKFVIKIERIGDKQLKVSVFDEGQRMTPEDAKRVFERFYKSDESRGLDKDGVGLGLYICKSIIDAHKQEIGVDVKDDGCEFWFTVKEGDYVRHRTAE